MTVNSDGSVDFYIGPKEPAGKGWFCLLRLYSPTEAWHEGKWLPGEIELVN